MGFETPWQENNSIEKRVIKMTKEELKKLQNINPLNEDEEFAIFQKNNPSVNLTKEQLLKNRINSTDEEIKEARQIMDKYNISFDSGDIVVETDEGKVTINTSKYDFGTEVIEKKI